MIQLYDYITSFDFIEDLKENSTIVSDIPIRKEATESTNIVSLEDFLKHKGPKNQGKIIGVTQYLTSQDMLLLQKSYNFKANRISLDPGIMSMIYKNSAESNDILSFLKEQYVISNPASQKDIIENLQKSHSYIRISRYSLPEGISDSKDGFLHIKKNDTTTSQYTIITDPANLNKLSIVNQLLQENGGGGLDIFIQQKYPALLSTSLKKSLLQTEHLVIILDHKATQEMWLYYDTLVKQDTTLKEIDIQYIFPQFHLVSSIFEEYVEEEANFDEKSIFEFLTP